MPGFIGIIANKIPDNPDIPLHPLGNILEREKRFDHAWLKRFIVPKFLQDKVFEEDGEIFICTDGLILNSRYLQNNMGLKSNFDVFKKLYGVQGSDFPRDIRGDFSGILFDKKKDIFLIFTNHTGSKPVFYFFDEQNNTLIFGSELKVVTAAMRILGYQPELSETGAYCLLTLGFMGANFTLVKDVWRVPPGVVLKFDGRTLLRHHYHQLSSLPYNRGPMDKLTIELDRRFQNAVRRIYEKDLEYGYRHIATLSGGLDSRLNVTYARKLGFKNLLTITFSQSNAPDESIAKKIAADYGFEFMFLSLDHGNYLKELEKPVHANDGLILYAGSAHLLNMISFINWSRLGLLQMGLGAALLKGSYLSGPVHERFNRDVMAGAGYSKKLVHKLSEDLFKAFEHYENDEIFLLNERDIHGMFNGYRMIEHFTDFASPFLDVDFLDYCLKIPPDLRFESKIYFHLMNTFVPEASEYIWEHTGYKINTGKYSIKFYAIMKRLYKKIYGDRPGDSMNPTEYWFRTNSELREVFRMYWEDHRSLLNDYPSIKEDAAFLFNQGTTLEKTQALTLLSAVKLLQLKKG